MGKDFSCESDVADLFDADGVHEESDLDFAAPYLRQRLGGLATIRDVVLVTDGFFGNMQSGFEQAFVELHHVQRLLAEGKFPEKRGTDGLRRMKQEGALGGNG